MVGLGWVGGSLKGEEETVGLGGSLKVKKRMVDLGRCLKVKEEVVGLEGSGEVGKVLAG